jgi:hypothetical protein
MHIAADLHVNVARMIGLPAACESELDLCAKS